MSEYKWKPFTLLVSAEEVKGNEMSKFNVGDRVYAEYCEVTGNGVVVEVSYDGVMNQRVKFDNFDRPLWVHNDRIKSLIAPSPIRTVTRREPVQGNYGIVAITKNNKIMIAAGDHSSEELEEAAHILSQLAEVKKENRE